MGSLPRRALPIGINHSRHPKLIFVFVPTKRHLHIWSALTVDLRFLKVEGSFHLFTSENHSGEIGLLQKLDESAGDFFVVTDHVKQNRAAVSNHHDLTGI